MVYNIYKNLATLLVKIIITHEKHTITSYNTC